MTLYFPPYDPSRGTTSVWKKQGATYLIRKPYIKWASKSHRAIQPQVTTQGNGFLAYRFCFRDWFLFCQNCMSMSKINSHSYFKQLSLTPRRWFATERALTHTLLRRARRCTRGDQNRAQLHSQRLIPAHPTPHPGLNSLVLSRVWKHWWKTNASHSFQSQRKREWVEVTEWQGQCPTQLYLLLCLVE